MCGRFSLTQSIEKIAEVFSIENFPPLQPRYNIAPTQPIATIWESEVGQNREFQMLRWGLIPSWSKDIKIGSKLINARSETVAEKPSFRSAFRKRRCLILADGFYEWQQQEKKKQPFYFQLHEHQPFAFAGLWEHYQASDGEEILSCTILTTDANDLMRPIHDRMPVILQPKDYDLWLDTKVQNPDLLQPLLQPYSNEEMTAYPVSTQVNKITNDHAELINSI